MIALSPLSVQRRHDAELDHHAQLVLDHPALRHRPVVVEADDGRGSPRVRPAVFRWWHAQPFLFLMPSYADVRHDLVPLGEDLLEVKTGVREGFLEEADAALHPLAPHEKWKERVAMGDELLVHVVIEIVEVGRARRLEELAHGFDVLLRRCHRIPSTHGPLLRAGTTRGRFANRPYTHRS